MNLIVLYSQAYLDQLLYMLTCMSLETDVLSELNNDNITWLK